MNINASSFLWPDEEKLVLFLIKAQEEGIAWDMSEWGNFQKDYLNPVVIPTIEHIPWVEWNIPIPLGIYNKIVKILKEKMHVGVYERSNSAYQSKWFCILKKDGKSLGLIHDLQPLKFHHHQGLWRTAYLRVIHRQLVRMWLLYWAGLVCSLLSQELISLVV